MQLSFIIPLYNAAPYIYICLESIFSSQVAESEYEVIVINDGSSDNGYDIVRQFRQHHKNIILINQDNKGASTARNKGLMNAKGDYIWFVDADDQIDPVFFSHLFCLLKLHPNCELFCFNHKTVSANYSSDNIDFPKEKIVNGIDFLRRNFSGFLWNKIYKKTAIGNTFFIDGTKNIEDFYFNIKVIINLKEILLLPAIGYYYNKNNINSTSTSHNLRNLIKLDQDSILIHNLLAKDLSTTVQKEKKEAILRLLNYSIAGHLFSLFRFYSPTRLKRRFRQYKRMNLYPIGKTINYKADAFVIIANMPFLMISLQKLYLKFYRRKH